jgi:ubiquinone/menaquinone biosynthesis C-methylase UbiE
MPEAIYEAAFQQALFDEMQSSYERVSNITSFGFNLRWRRQLVGLLDLRPEMQVADLMAGGGETWKYILPRIGAEGRLKAVDFSCQMVQEACRRQRHLRASTITILSENVLSTSIPSGSVDRIVCVYGVKTLAPCQHQDFVCEIKRILKPDGVFGLVEVSAPPFVLLKVFYLFYLSKVVPIVGKLLLGNPHNYRLLGTYVSAFGDCHTLERVFCEQDFEVCYHHFFWGCASALVGRKKRN